MRFKAVHQFSALTLTTVFALTLFLVSCGKDPKDVTQQANTTTDLGGVSSTSGTTGSDDSDSSDNAFEDLAVSYSPDPVYTGDTVTLNVSGGLAPYSYSLVSGAGSLSGNLYSTTSSPETATIQVTDSLSKSITVEIPVLDSSVDEGSGDDGDSGSGDGGSGSSKKRYVHYVGCMSLKNKTLSCYTGKRITRVQLFQEYSKHRCIRGVTWAVDWKKKLIVVTRGCSASFKITSR